MATTIVDDLLWENFHRVVNMPSRELREWLAVQGAGEETEEVPDRAGSPVGHHVLAVLGKRRVDLTPTDAQVMAEVVDLVVGVRGEELDAAVDDDATRRALMDVGHDPLRS